MIFTYSLYLIFTIFSFYVVGIILNLGLKYITPNKTIQESPLSFMGLFLLSIEGLFTSIIIYGLIIQKLNSILLLFLPLFIYYLFKKKNNFDFNFIQKNDYKNIVYSIFFIILITAFFSIFYFDYETMLPNNIIHDFKYSSKISQYLNLGFENILTDKNLILDTKYVEPYHYFELWINALLSKMYKTNSSLTFIFITWQYMLLLIFLGFNAIFSIDLKLKTKHIIFVSFSLFSFCFYSTFTDYPLIDSIFNNYSFQSIFLNPKYCLIVVALILSYIYYKQNQFEISILWLLSLPLINTVTLPSICISLSFYLLFNLILKRINFYTSCKLFLYLVFYSLTIYSFYYIINKSNGIISNYSVFNLNALTGINFIYCFIFGLSGIFAYPIILYSLVNSIFLKKTIDLFSNFSLFILSFLIGGSISLYLLYNMADARQLLQLPYFYVLFVASIILSFKFFYFAKNLKQKVFIITLILFSFYSICNNLLIVQSNLAISKGYKYKLYQLFNLKSSTICIIKDSKDINTIYSTNFDLSLPGSYITLINDKNILVTMYLNEIDSISDPNLLKDKKIIDVQKEYSFEYIYKKQNKITNDSVYFNKFNFEYIVLSKNAQLPNFLVNRVKFCIKDSLSKESIFKIIN